jgi:putative ABC transport system permease protein
MVRGALAEVRGNPRRIIAVVVAIMISVGYLAASVTIVASESATMERDVIARVSNVDVVVTLADPETSPQAAVVKEIRELGGVTSAELVYLSHGRVSGSSEWVQQQSVPSDPRLQWTGLAEGDWPDEPNEIALGATTAEQLNTRIGDKITISDPGSSATLTVTGLTHEGKSLFSGISQSSFVAPSFYSGRESIRKSLQTEILVIGDGTLEPDQLAEKVKTVAAGSSADDRVETSSAFTQRKMSEQANGVLIFQILLLVFGAIALLVGSIMIANTFLILVTQRRRQTGLLRAVGADSAQIRRSLFVEALTIGSIGSALGVLLGVGVAALVAAGIGEELTVPVVQVSVVAAIGVVIAVLSVVVPARRATRVSPLEALRPVNDRQTERRASMFRVVVSLALLIIGLAVIGLGFTDSPYALLLSVAGSFVLAVGLLSATGIYLPFMVRAGGALLAKLGPIARLAANNTIRNPGRAAGTAAALILAVGLVVTLQVGAASMKATSDGNVDARFPVDVTVSAFNGALPDRTADGIAEVPGITDTAKLAATRGSLKLGSKKMNLWILAPGADAARVVPTAYAAVSDDKILADPYLLVDSGTAEGSTVTLTGKTGTITLPIAANYLAPADTLVVSPALLKKLDPEAAVGVVWAKASPSADITELRSRLRDVVAPVTGAEVGGGLSAKVSYHEVLDRLLLVATMLLAIAVLIAVIGVGNTLGLSVLERTRESALLRALGLQGRDLRWMLAAEAVLLSVSSTLVGIAAGVFFGCLGTHAISGELKFATVSLSVSVPQTLTVAVVAIVAGMVASVIPGRRAARAIPVEALAEE